MAVFTVRVPLFGFSNSKTALSKRVGIAHAIVHVYEKDNPIHEWCDFTGGADVVARTACGRDLALMYGGHKQHRMCSICHGFLSTSRYHDPYKPVPVILEPPVPQEPNVRDDQYQLQL